MKLHLEEAFKMLNEENEEIKSKSSKAEADELKKWDECNNLAEGFGDKEIEIDFEKSDRALLDLWDQVYCSLTDGSDNRVYALLGNWSGQKRYPVTHVTPSTATHSMLPRGFKTKPGYLDIIVFSPQMDIKSMILDNESPDEEEVASIERRNKKNRKLNFDYAKQVAEVYHLPYEELENAFVLYVPKSKYLSAETLDPNNAMKLFPDDLILDYLNNTNQKEEIDGETRFCYDLRPYFDAKSMFSKNAKLNFMKNNIDMQNWINDTADQMFNDTFGISQAQADYTPAEEKIFDQLLAKTFDIATIAADKAKAEWLAENKLESNTEQAENSEE